MTELLAVFFVISFYLCNNFCLSIILSSLLNLFEKCYLTQHISIVAMKSLDNTFYEVLYIREIDTNMHLHVDKTRTECVKDAGHCILFYRSVSKYRSHVPRCHRCECLFFNRIILNNFDRKNTYIGPY